MATKKLSTFDKAKAAMLADLAKATEKVKKAKTYAQLDVVAVSPHSKKTNDLLDKLFDEEEAQ